MKAAHNLSVICPNCSYDANLPTATHCEICNQPLRRDRPKSSRNLKLGWILGIGLLLLFGELYFLGRNYLASQTTASNLSSPIATPAPNSQPVTNNLTSSVEIRHYDLMTEVPNVPDGVFNYGGAVVFAALTARGMNDAIERSHPQFRLRYVAPVNGKPNSRAGIAMLLDGELSFAQTVLPLKEVDYEQAQKRGIILEQVPVAIDQIVFFTSPQLPVNRLTVSELQAIYTGKVKNWNQLGGPNLAIVAVALDPKISSTISILLNRLENPELSPEIQVVGDYTTAIRQVAATPGAISYGSAASVMNQQTIGPLLIAKDKSTQYVEPFINSQINAKVFRDGSYPLTRQLFVVLSHKGKPQYQAGVAYTNFLLSKEGQKIVEQAGFVPIR